MENVSDNNNAVQPTPPPAPVQSTKVGGKELSGDYNNYSKEWEENFKGLTVKCKGDGTLINCANADVETTHFAVLINPGQEGKGLTADELKSIFMGMQAGPLETK